MSSTNKLLTTAIAAAVGLTAGAGAMYYLQPQLGEATTSSEKSADEPLYWVAPMDANYRRDKPGKSPMGMDLVPVYADDATSNSSPGTVAISPEVQFNLGLKTVKVLQGQLEQNINTFANISVNPNQIQHIHPRVSGWIETLHVKAVGDQVAAGDALYDIYSPELVAAQEEYLLALERSSGSTSSRLLQAASARLKALGLIDSQINTLKNSRRIKQTMTIYSPSNGVVQTLNIAQGFFVNPGTSMFSIADLSTVWLNAKVFERDADLLTVGMPAEIELGFNANKRLDATVSYIEPNIDAKTRSVIARIELANPDMALKPNMFAKVNLVAESDERYTYVPLSSVIRTGTQDRVVLELEPGQYKSIEVQTGQVWGDQIAITDGLNPGETIVSSAQFMIDSESSKNSDFARIDKAGDSLWTEATFVAVMADKATVEHPAIEAWDWPEMTMDFSYADDLDPELVAQLQAGTEAHIEITKADRQYLISDIHILSQPGQSSGNSSSDSEPSFEDFFDFSESPSDGN